MKLCKGTSFRVETDQHHETFYHRKKRYPNVRLWLVETVYLIDQPSYTTIVTAYSDLPPAFCNQGGTAS